MAGKSSRSGNWAPDSPATRYKASGKNREFYTFENAPGLGAYATGGTIIDGGDGYIYHIFTGGGVFEIPSNTPSTQLNSVDYLIVAGGGGASAPYSSPGGGGGGGMLFGNMGVSPGSYPISVGAGGPSSPNVTSSTRNGTPSSAFGITANGGGGGGEPGTPSSQRVGSPGGSGGGGGGTPGTAPVPTTSGSAIDTIPRQGYPSTPIPVNGINRGGCGGGGAGGLGQVGTGPPALGGAGGPGRIAPEFPSTIVRQAIPAPLLPSWEPLVGSGGYSRGGNGFPFPTSQNSPNNSGYGGSDLAGGSGIVCIRYKKTVPYQRATGGTIEPSTDPEHPGVWRHIFTEPGTFEVTDPTLQWIDYLAVGGGGGGGSYIGGGGGAGGFVSSIHTSTTTPTVIPEAYPWNPGYSVEVGEQYPVGVGTYPISIGAGGAGGDSANPLPQRGTPGDNTTIGNPGVAQIIAYGGGGGGGSIVHSPPAPPGARITGLSGGSGGGASGTNGGPPSFPFTVSGGTATPTPTIQGNSGDSKSQIPSDGGGGGGAGGPAVGGVNRGGWYSVLSPSAYGTPGPLTPTAIYRYFAGGGGGGGNAGNGISGGAGGGGRGGSFPGSPDGHPVNGVDGTTNTGGGGGGGAQESTAIGGSGGPGIVIIQYPE